MVLEEILDPAVLLDIQVFEVLHPMGNYFVRMVPVQDSLDPMVLVILGNFPVRKVLEDLVLRGDSLRTFHLRQGYP